MLTVIIIRCKIYFVFFIFVVYANHENILQRKFPDLRHMLLSTMLTMLRISIVLASNPGSSPTEKRLEDLITCPVTYYVSGGSEPGLNGLDNLYIPTSILAICFFVLEDSSPSAETCSDTERRACPQAAAFLNRRTGITPSTYVYTSFVSDLVLAKSVAVGKTPKQVLLFDRLLHWPHIAWVWCHHYQTESTLHTNRFHHFRSVT